MKRPPEEVSAYMAKIGAKGGKSGKGKSKKRSPSHYRKLVKIRKRNREEQK
jgi:hypothetical protein